ncbi:MAG: acetylglutamate kinase [Pseudomonadota bacterium]
MVDITFRDRATTLLSNLEEGREVRTYLKAFSRAEGGCFAVIKVGGALVNDACEALGRHLALLQALELKPIVVYGAGPQLDKRLSALGVGTERRDGLRVTPPEAVSVVAQEAAATGMAIANAISAAGGHAMLAPTSTVLAKALDEEKYGRVGEAKGVHTSGLQQLLDNDAVPLIGCVAQDEAGLLYNVNADAIAREVARALQPPKIVFLTSTGGLLDEEGEIINSINLASDFDRLIAEDWVHSGMALKLEQIKKLLEDLPSSSSVSMTDTDHMMKELFTHGGAGTLIRRGEKVHVSQTADAERLTPLISEAFSRPLRADYFDTVAPEYVVHTERFRAAAIVTELDGVHCLDKFAVSGSARGEGLAKVVWRTLQERSKSLIWRSRKNNPFNSFYLNEADGFLRRGPWIILWYGEIDQGEVFALADKLGNRPPDFTGPEILDGCVT